MKLKTKAPEPIGFQLAPMLDVVFLLLIFFVVTQRIILNEQDLKVKVPTAPSNDEEVSRAIDEIIVNAREENGELIITVDREVFTREKLYNMLRNMVQTNPSVSVRIRGDADMKWQRVVDVIVTCTQAGVYNVSFPSRLPQEGEQYESRAVCVTANVHITANVPPGVLPASVLFSHSVFFFLRLRLLFPSGSFCNFLFP